MALRLVVADNESEREAAREVEARVFLQSFGNTPEIMAAEYGPYESRSRFLAIIDDQTGQALGAARLLPPGADDEPSKSLVDAAEGPWKLDVDGALRAAGLAHRPVWDVASLAVDRRFRTGAAGSELVLALCHGIAEHPRRCGGAGLVMILDDRVLRLLRVVGIPVEPLEGAGSRPYLGSPASTPCMVHIDVIAPTVRARRPDLGPAIGDGVLTSISVDPDDLAADRGQPAQTAGRPATRAVQRHLTRTGSMVAPASEPVAGS